MIIEADQLNSAIQVLFDPGWYLQKYPDVAQAGVDPWCHYDQFGQAEGRLPCQFDALKLDEELWFNNVMHGIVELKAYTYDINALSSMSVKARVNLFLAHWALARWYAAQGRQDEACEHLELWLGEVANENPPKDERYLHERLLALKVVGHLGPYKLWFSLLCQQESRINEAKSLLNDPIWVENALQLSLAEQAEISDLCLAKASLPNTPGANKLAELNYIFRARDLITLDQGKQSSALLDDLVPARQQPGHQPVQTIISKVWNWLMPERLQTVPLISVIVPCFNASRHILTTLDALYAQTWERIEVIVVDDASTDDSALLVDGYFDHREPRRGFRLRLIRQPKNQGAYAARNAGMSQAKGRFLTVHDSDDWSHPQKLELQARALLHNKTVESCMAHWVRCSSDLTFSRWRAEPTWVYPNVSSLMIRRRVLKRQGYWDLVSVNADSEYVERLRSVYGVNAVAEVLPGVPLSFGRHDDSSLSQQDKTHLRTQFFGVRRDYMTIARAWHQSQIAKQRPLYLPAKPGKPAFPVPPMIFRGDANMRERNLENWLKESEFFDTAYYLDRYPDIAQAGVDPYRHYLANGEDEGRDPSALFSASGYRAARSVNGKPLSAAQCALHEAAYEGLATAAGAASSRVLLNYVKAPGLAENVAAGQSKPWIAVCGHSAQGQAFGAENSLLDVLEALQQDWQIVLVLPQALAADYIARLSKHADSIVVFPYQWWHQQRQPNAVTEAAFVRLFKEYCVKGVYVNTLTLDEPLRAAKSMRLPVTVHVRELLRDDPGLLTTLGLENGNACSPLMSFLAKHADLLLANSATLAAWLSSELESIAQTSPHKRIEVVPNCVRLPSGNPMSALSLPCVRTGSQARLQVAMFSSNLPKKGVYDFFELAESLADCADFHLYGPLNEHTEKLSNANNPAMNVTLHGYIGDISEEMAGLDVVVNLSHFAESFGRSILEAMAAGKVVAAYRHGALPELIGDAGVLTERENVLAMSAALRALTADLDSAVQLAQKAASRASLYAFESYAARLREVLNSVQ